MSYSRAYAGLYPELPYLGIMNPFLTKTSLFLLSKVKIVLSKLGIRSGFGNFIYCVLYPSIIVLSFRESWLTNPFR
jgi:hypothetical protein